jgi:hypothetical protein
LCSILNIIIICFHRGVDKNCGSKCKRKVVDVTHSKQENINKRTSKQVSRYISYLLLKLNKLLTIFIILY